MLSNATSNQALIDATGRPTPSEALTWLADGHPIELGSDLHKLLRAVVMVGDDHEDQQRAIRRLARLLASSDLDSAAILFQAETIIPASRFRKVLDSLASHCSGGSLANITSSALIAAQRRDPFTVEALCAVAGLSYKELTERVGDLPPTTAKTIGPSQLRRAFDALDAVICARTTTDLPGAVPARPLELMPNVGLGGADWGVVERLRTEGVPYELLLAQRAAGGAWLAHRNRTSSQLAQLVANRLCQELEARNVEFRRSAIVGGHTTPNDMSRLSGCDKQIGLIILDAGDHALFGVIFSMARDSGTASKNASRLRAMKRPRGLPIAVVVGGPGWAARNETADLALDFEGRLYSERALPDLADEILGAVTTHRMEVR